MQTRASNFTPRFALNISLAVLAAVGISGFSTASFAQSQPSDQSQSEQMQSQEYGSGGSSMQEHGQNEQNAAGMHSGMPSGDMQSSQQGENQSNQQSGESSGMMASQGSSTSCPDQFKALKGDQNGQVSEQDARKVREKVFSALDTNHNDVISRSEYVHCLARTPAFSATGVASLGRRPDQMALLNSSEKNFTNVDQNNDGKISWDEYMKAAEQNRSVASNNPASGTAQANENASAIAGWTFARLDTDLSGTISPQEWGAKPTSFENTLNQSFAAADSDQNGGISAEEYQSAIDSEFNDAAQNSSGQEDAGIPAYRVWVFHP